ncbi:hypothetical protein VNO77_18917 [Canavalia gladiata]|uniref:Uncharacterized protein n=1 Tax=Canavalia gladiata TaxID=3824 RepID=A0AAN9LLT1_CANGL
MKESTPYLDIVRVHGGVSYVTQQRRCGDGSGKAPIPSAEPTYAYWDQHPGHPQRAFNGPMQVAYTSQKHPLKLVKCFKDPNESLV